MLVYILILLMFLITYILSKKYKLSRKYFLFIFFAMITIVLGLRGSNVGEDTQEYINIANASLDISWSSILSQFPRSTWKVISYGIYGSYSGSIETVFLFIVKLIMEITGNAQVVIFSIGLITSTLFGNFIVKNIRDRENIYLACFVFLCESSFMNCFNTSRQMLAVSIGLQSIQCIKNKKFKNAVIWIIAASLIHFSAIVYIMLIPIYMIKDKYKGMKYVISGALITYFIPKLIVYIVNGFFPLYSAYIEKNYWENSIGGIIIIWILICSIIVLVYFKKLGDNDDYFVIYMMIIYILFELISIQYTLFSRLAIYFRVFEILFFTQSVRYFKGKTQIFYKLIIIGIFLIYFLIYCSSTSRLYVPFWL